MSPQTQLNSGVSRLMSVAELEQAVRDRINEPRRRLKIMASSADWNTVCSALDVIGDTALGLSAYVDHPSVEEVGLRYLFVYGAFQLLQTQQDAVSYLCTALNLKTSTKPKIPRLSTLRSEAVAHPAYGRESGAQKVGFIQRVSLSHRGFRMMTAYSDGSPYRFTDVNLPELIQEQESTLSEVLTEAIELMDADEEQHRQEHRGTKLVDAFPDACAQSATM